MNPITAAVTAADLQVWALGGVLGAPGGLDRCRLAVLAVEDLTRRAQVEETRQAAEQAARRVLGEER